jgi:hypothetical protein
LTTAAPTVCQRDSISPEEGTILKSRNHRSIYRLPRAKMQHAFHSCPTQREMETLRRDTCATRQLRREMCNHNITINHALLPSKGYLMTVPSVCHLSAS